MFFGRFDKGQEGIYSSNELFQHRRNAQDWERNRKASALYKPSQGPLRNFQHYSLPGGYSEVYRGEWIFGDYEQPLGRGKHGHVAEHLIKGWDYIEESAQKVFTSPQAEAEMIKEYEIATTLRSRLPPKSRSHIIQIFSAYAVSDNHTNLPWEEHTKQYCVRAAPVADYNLKSFLDSQVHAPGDLRRIMGCLIVGLANMHEAGVWHHDIHPLNILMAKGRPIYTDFGHAHLFQEEADEIPLSDNEVDDSDANENNNIAGNRSATPQARYAIPELCDQHQKSEKGDVLSLGVVFFYIMAGMTGDTTLMEHRSGMGPFWSAQVVGNEEVNAEVRQALETAEICHKEHASYLSITKSMLKRDAKERPTTRELVARLPLIPGELGMCDNCHTWRTKMSGQVTADRAGDPPSFLSNCNVS
ncbi:kinase-like domain-containing protein [Pyrenochaeta sp. MPI-SDFR-AT-0127]|nr:kinase-like domain-containing protein [Pyrenochaeta sp. MPI-SDFR-AT-0127]